MYNFVFPKEALELYSIIKLDKNNFIMQDVFYLIYHLSNRNNIKDTIYNIKKTLKANNSIYEIESLFLNSENLKSIYLNFSISNTLNDSNYKDKYENAYSEIKKIYTNIDLNNLIYIYNSKQKLYDLLENHNQTKESKEEFNQLIDIISAYTEKEEIQNYCDYFENKDSLILKIFNLKKGVFKFNELKQLENLKNRGEHSNYFNLKNLNRNIILTNESKRKSFLYIIKSIIKNILLITLLTLILHPFSFLNEYIKTNNINLLAPFGIYIIISLFMISNIIINILTIFSINNNLASIYTGYISDIGNSPSTRHNIITIYLPVYNAHITTNFNKFTSKQVVPMNKILVIQTFNKYICIPEEKKKTSRSINHVSAKRIYD